MPAPEDASGRARAWLAVVPVLAAVALAAPAAWAQLGVEGGAQDLGDLARGDAAVATVTVRNGGASALDLAVTFEGDGDAALAADPAALTLAPGGAADIEVTLNVDADAAPGRHENAVVIAPAASGGGGQAVGAARVALVHRVPVVDVAYASIGENGTLFVRIVNGHPTAWTVAATVETLRGAATVEALDIPATVVASLASQLVYWAPDPALHTDGTYTLSISGTASAGAAEEPLGASYVLTVAGGVFTLAPPAAPRPGGGGGWDAPEELAPPTAPAGDTPTPSPPPGPGDEEAPAATAMPTPTSPPAAPDDGAVPAFFDVLDGRNIAVIVLFAVVAASLLLAFGRTGSR